MSTDGHPNDRAVERLRAEFDRAFAAAPAPPARDTSRLLAIRVGGDPYALRLEGVLAVHVDRKIVPLPSTSPTLMGIASFRGALTPVHDLRLLLGYPGRSATRWLVLIAAATPIGLAFDAFEGQVVSADDPTASGVPPTAGSRARPSALAGGLVRVLDGVRPLIDVAAVLATVGVRPAASQPPRAPER